MMIYSTTREQMPLISRDSYGKWYYLYKVEPYPNKGFGLMYYYRRDDE